MNTKRKGRGLLKSAATFCLWLAVAVLLLPTMVISATASGLLRVLDVLADAACDLENAA